MVMAAAGHFIFASERCGVLLEGDGVEGFDASAGAESGEGLVESRYGRLLADSENLQVQCRPNRLIVAS